MLLRAQYIAPCIRLSIGRNVHNASSQGSRQQRNQEHLLSHIRSLWLHQAHGILPAVSRFIGLTTHQVSHIPSSPNDAERKIPKPLPRRTAMCMPDKHVALQPSVHSRFLLRESAGQQAVHSAVPFRLIFCSGYISLGVGRESRHDAFSSSDPFLLRWRCRSIRHTLLMMQTWTGRE